MYRLGIAAYQGVPIPKRLPARPQPVSTGNGEPVEATRHIGRQVDTVGHQLGAAGVITAAATLLIQVPATYFRVENLVGLLVLELVQAAFRAAITQRFPLICVQGLQ